MKNSKISSCPHCGGTGGVFLSVKVSGDSMEFYDFQGQISEGLMSDEITYKFSKYCFCTDCGKRLYRVEATADGLVRL